jgi:hypothetical protein
VVVAMIGNNYVIRSKFSFSIGELDLAIADYSLALEIDSKNSHQQKN